MRRFLIIALVIMSTGSLAFSSGHYKQQVEQTANSIVCGFAFTNPVMNIPATAATGTITVMLPDGCSWTATSNVPWITITSGTSGSGNGTIKFAVPANNSAPRTGIITVGSAPLTINQAGTGAAAVVVRS